MRTIDEAPTSGTTAVPNVWRDLSRDWNTWSKAERAFAATVVASLPTLLLTIVCVLA